MHINRNCSFLTMLNYTLSIIAFLLFVSSCTVSKSLNGTWANELNNKVQIIKFDRDTVVFNPNSDPEYYDYEYMGYTRTDIVFYLNQNEENGDYSYNEKYYARFKSPHKMTLKKIEKETLNMEGKTLNMDPVSTTIIGEFTRPKQ